MAVPLVLAAASRSSGGYGPGGDGDEGCLIAAMIFFGILLAICVGGLLMSIFGLWSD